MGCNPREAQALQNLGGEGGGGEKLKGEEVERVKIEGRVTTGRSRSTESSGRPAGRQGVQRGCGEWGPQEKRR